MKKILTLGFLSTVAVSAVAQFRIPEKVAEKQPVFEQKQSISTVRESNAPETIIWSENFANGFPSTWLIAQGTSAGVPNSDVVWEYRGPATTPTAASGGRGSCTSTLVIASPTAANGYALFDSDWLDNRGTGCGTPAGISNSPHVAKLTTSPINLSAVGANAVLELQFSQLYWKFQGNGGTSATSATFVEFSPDGGVTWTAPVALNTTVAVNTSTSAPVAVTLPSSLNGSSNAMIRFVFDGNYYFWMIDDIQIVGAPANRVEFATVDGNPPVDLNFGPTYGSSTRMGNMSLKQVRAITFDGNAVNTGSSAQSNAQFKVDLINLTTNAITTLSSTVEPTWAAGDTIDVTTFNTYTAAWTPASDDPYGVVYKIVTDSLTVVYPDTFFVNVTEDVHSLDFNSLDNTIGTNQLGDGCKVTVRHDFIDNERLFGAEARMSFATQSGVLVELAVHDSATYYAANLAPSTPPIAYAQLVVSPADSAAGWLEFDFTDATTGLPVVLPAGAYFFEMTMLGGGKVARVWNDQSFTKVSGTAYMYDADDATWYTGYGGGSRSFNNPWIRSLTCSHLNASTCMTVGFDENPMAELALAPNPATDYVNVSFGMLTGQYQIEVLDLTGKVVKSELVRAGSNVPVFVGNLDRGMYVVRVAKGTDVKTFKVSLL